jgi:hypothetical protein
MAYYYIHTPTKELFNKVQEVAFTKGMKWGRGQTSVQDYWRGERHCININDGTRLTHASSRSSWDIEAIDWIAQEQTFNPEVQFKIGDFVVLDEDYRDYKAGLVGHIGAIDCMGDCVTFRYGSGGSFNVYPKRLRPYTVQGKPDEQLTNKEGHMTRFYKLLTDKPEYVAGAILQGTQSGTYAVLSPLLFATEAEEKAIERGAPSHFQFEFVKDSADFEQVYQIQHRDGVKYGTKAQARAAMEATTSEPKKSK